MPAERAATRVYLPPSAGCTDLHAPVYNTEWSSPYGCHVFTPRPRLHPPLVWHTVQLSTMSAVTCWRSVDQSYGEFASTRCHRYRFCWIPEHSSAATRVLGVGLPHCTVKNISRIRRKTRCRSVVLRRSMWLVLRAHVLITRCCVAGIIPAYTIY